MGENGSTGRLDVAEVFSETAAIYKRAFLKVWLLALVLLVPVQVVSLALGDSLISLIAEVLYIVAATWLAGAIVKLVQDAETGREGDRSIGELLGAVWPKLLPLVLLSFVTGVLVVLGLLLLVVPGVILGLMWVVVVPVMVVEGLGVFDSMSRSSDLTRDNRMAIFWILLALLVAELILIGLGFALADFNVVAFAAIAVIARIVIYPYLAIITTVLYFRLYRLKGSKPFRF